MAKLSFTKLGLKQSQDVEQINYNEQTIEVIQYLPVEKKLEIIEHVVNKSSDENNFANPIKVKMFFVLEIIDYYTNITFTDKQKESPQKLYDLLVESRLINTIINKIPQCEYTSLHDDLWETIESIYKYRNSALGVMEIISQDYNNLDFDASNIQKTLSDPKSMGLLKDVLTKLG